MTVTTRKSGDYNYFPPVEPAEPVTLTEEEEPSTTVEEEEQSPTEEQPQPQVEFNDVSQDHWAAGAIKRAFVLNIVKGYLDQSFKPNEATTRA